MGRLALAAIFVGLASASPAHEPQEARQKEAIAMQGAIDRKLNARSELPNVPGHVLTAVTVTLAPGAIAAPHRHDGFVFAYVLAGTVRSQLDDEEPQDFSAGDSWVEPPGVLHTLTQNLSSTEDAELLAVFVAKAGASLTTPGPIEDHP